MNFRIYSIKIDRKGLIYLLQELHHHGKVLSNGPPPVGLAEDGWPQINARYEHRESLRQVQILWHRLQKAACQCLAEAGEDSCHDRCD